MARFGGTNVNYAKQRIVVVWVITNQINSQQPFRVTFYIHLQYLVGQAS